MELSGDMLYVRSVALKDSREGNISFQAGPLAKVYVKDWKLYTEHSPRDLLLQTVGSMTEYYYPTAGLEAVIKAAGKAIGIPETTVWAEKLSFNPNVSSHGGVSVHIREGDDARAVMRKAVKKFGAGTVCMNGKKIAPKLAAYIKKMAESDKLAAVSRTDQTQWVGGAPAMSLNCRSEYPANDKGVASVTWEKRLDIAVEDGKLVAVKVDPSKYPR